MTTGWASWSEQSTTSRLLTIAARRSSSSCDQAALGQAVEGHLDHADRAGDDLRARRDHRFGLLPAQHRAGDLRRVGQVRELGVDDDDAGLGEALLQLVAQGRRRPAPVPERSVTSSGGGVRLLEVVVGVAEGEVAHRRLGLRQDVGLVVLDVEARLRRVVDAPDDRRRDLDRVAAQVVDLELLAVEVVRAHRDLGLGVERIGPAQAALAVGAAVAAEERQQHRLVRLQHVEAGQAPDGDQEAEDQDDHRQPRRPHQQQADGAQQEEKTDGDVDEAVAGRGGAFLGRLDRHDMLPVNHPWLDRRRAGDVKVISL